MKSSALCRDDLGWRDKDEKRFWAKVDKSGDCWLFKNQKARYGYLGVSGKNYRVNRLSYALYCGTIPEDIEVCHTCDNDKCVRPSHLFLGTHLDNMQDMVTKDRSADKSGRLNGRAKLDPIAVLQILRLSETLSKAEIGRRFDVSDVTIFGICDGRLWSHVTGIQKAKAA